MDFTAEIEEVEQSTDSSARGKQTYFAQDVFPVSQDYQRALVVVNDLVFAKRGKYLSELELFIIRGALNHREYHEIAHYCKYTHNYIQRTVAPPLWKLLTEVLGTTESGESVGKLNLYYFLDQLNKKYYISSASISGNKPDLQNSVNIIGQIPATSFFCGRKRELALLQQLLDKQQSISILGVAGIGKSTLVAKLIQQVQGFEQIIWKTFNHTPLLQDVVTELLELVSSNEIKKIPEYPQALISLLIKYLQSRRCLLVLDGIEYLFSRNNFFQKVEYATFLRRLIEEEHQSCLILTSRIWPDELDDIIIANKPTYCFRLEGLDVKAAKKFLIHKGFKYTDKIDQLIQTYYGNPSELEAAVNRIYHFFGNQEKFFENPTTFISSRLEAMLNDLFGGNLSNLQKKIIIFITENTILGNQVTFSMLVKCLEIDKAVSTLEIIKGLEKLERLSLIESTKDPFTKEINFSIQPVIKKYITTDPMGLVHSFNDSSQITIAS